MDIIDKIISNVQKTKKVVVQKSSDAFEITKLKIAISSAEGEAQEILREIGSLVYGAYKNGEENGELVEEKCASLEKLKKDIDDKKNQFSKLRNLKRCCECDRENDADASYCNYCGAKLCDVVGFEVSDMPEGSEKKDDVIIDADSEG